MGLDPGHFAGYGLYVTNNLFAKTNNLGNVRTLPKYLFF